MHARELEGTAARLFLSLGEQCSKYNIPLPPRITTRLARDSRTLLAPGRQLETEYTVQVDTTHTFLMHILSCTGCVPIRRIGRRELAAGYCQLADPRLLQLRCLHRSLEPSTHTPRRCDWRQEQSVHNKHPSMRRSLRSRLAHT
jgi:hypothetical protein